MQTPHSNRSVNYKKGRKLSEASIMLGFKNSPVWKLLFFKPKEAFWMLFAQYIQTNAAVLSYCYTAVTRCLHGQLVCGVALTMMGASIMLALNSTHVWPGLAPFTAFAVPVLPFFKNVDELYRLAVIEVRSQAIIVYCGVFIVASLVNTIICWFGKGNKNATQRGVGYLYLLVNFLFSKHLKVGQFFIHFLEALLFIGLGVYLWLERIDPYFGWFLILISFNEMIALLSEKSGQLHSKALLEA